MKYTSSIQLQPFLQAGRIEAGCDEAGRGCLAGPVFAAAVILPVDLAARLTDGRSALGALNDSKQLTEAQRYALRPHIEEEATAWAVALCDNHEIDRLNILRASIEAMHRALRGLSGADCYKKGGVTLRPAIILVDGNRFYPFEDIPYETIVKGDGKMMSIAAASILAKTYRDDYMTALGQQYPAYHWEVNKGYPTKAHRTAIAQHGLTSWHRESFRQLPDDRQLTLSFE